MSLTRPTTNRDLCAHDNDHELPAEALVYDENEARYVGLEAARVVCNEECAEALTDELVGRMS